MPVIKHHFDRIILPALAEYKLAEITLTQALTSGNLENLNVVRDELMRRARTASIELHQFTDFVLSEGNIVDIGKIRNKLDMKCVFLRTNNKVKDVSLLRDIADAFKHHTLSRKNTRVVGSSAIIACQTGYSVLFYGEGKNGGVEQIVVTQANGEQRALSSIIQNVSDVWRLYFNWHLPPIGDYSTL